MTVSDARRLKELETENGKLKKLLAEAEPAKRAKLQRELRDVMKLRLCPACAHLIRELQDRDKAKPRRQANDRRGF